MTNLLILVKSDIGKWVVDEDSEHHLEPRGYGISNGAVVELQVDKITPLRKHPNDPSAD